MFSDDSIFSLLGFCFPPPKLFLSWSVIPRLSRMSCDVNSPWISCQRLCVLRLATGRPCWFTLPGSHVLRFWLLSQACGLVSLPIWPQVPKVNSLQSKWEKFIKAVITFASINKSSHYNAGLFGQKENCVNLDELPSNRLYIHTLRGIQTHSFL